MLKTRWISPSSFLATSIIVACVALAKSVVEIATAVCMIRSISHIIILITNLHGMRYTQG